MRREEVKVELLMGRMRGCSGDETETKVGRSF